MTLIVSVKIINGCPYKRLKYGTNETLIASVVNLCVFSVLCERKHGYRNYAKYFDISRRCFCLCGF